MNGTNVLRLCRICFNQVSDTERTIMKELIVSRSFWHRGHTGKHRAVRRQRDWDVDMGMSLFCGSHEKTRKGKWAEEGLP